jgi:hypothetical protein
MFAYGPVLSLCFIYLFRPLQDFRNTTSSKSPQILVGVTGEAVRGSSKLTCCVFTLGALSKYPPFQLKNYIFFKISLFFL